MNNIYLIGFMGTGKTTVAHALAKKIHWQVVDTDQYIVEKMQMSIPEIFEEYGEERFREIETEVLTEISEKDQQIISCGGGVAMRENNVRIMKEHGTTVLLSATPQTILHRVKKDKNRPLLKGRKTVEGIRELMEERVPAYEAAADYKIVSDGRKAYRIAREIQTILR